MLRNGKAASEHPQLFNNTAAGAAAARISVCVAWHASLFSNAGSQVANEEQQQEVRCAQVSACSLQQRALSSHYIASAVPSHYPEKLHSLTHHNPAQDQSIKESGGPVVAQSAAKTLNADP